MNIIKFIFYFYISIFFLSLTDLVESASCPLYSTGSTSYYPDPVAVSPNQFGYSQTCCTPELTASILNTTDRISAFLKANLSKRTTSCDAAIQALASSVCSPDSVNWFSSHSYGIDFTPCPSSFCTAFQSACSGSNFFPLGGAPVTSVDPELLCTKILPVEYRVFVATVNPSHPHPPCFALPTATNPGPCTADDYEGLYTSCATSTREVTFHWKDDTTCQGGAVLPPDITDLPCLVSCPLGTYLPLGTTQCQPCSPGTFSIGGGSRVSLWKEWPSPADYRLETHCTLGGSTYASGFNTTCGWQLSDNQIRSGAIGDRSTSVLQLRTFIVGSGAIEIAYQVDSEPGFDGLKISVDGTQVLSVLRPVIQWTVWRYNLNPGAHVIEFAYYKDYSASSGADAAFIQYIQIEGTFAVPQSCTPCNPGSFTAVAGASNCSKCIDNTYSSQGAATCSSCPDDTYSFSGSFMCTPRPVCNVSDYDFVYSECFLSGGLPVRDRYAQWTSPRICANGVDLPDTQHGLPCAPCNPGQYRDGATCKFCPVGTISDGTTASCTSCPAGQVAPLSLAFSQFQSWPAGFSTQCIGSGCNTPGWRLLGDRVDSGIGHLIPAESILSYEASLKTKGTMIIDFEFRCRLNCMFSVRFSGQTAGRFSMYQRTARYTRTIEVVAGNQTIDFTFNKIDTSTQSSFDTVIIHSVTFTGTAYGGGVACASCALGSAAPLPASSCTPCPAGTYRNSSTAIQCSSCDARSYSGVAGSVNCETCGNAIYSTADRTSCDLNDCRFSVGSLTWDLSPLRKPSDMWGPILDMHGHTYFVNICNKFHNNHTCFDTAGNNIPSYACQVTNAGVGKDLGHVMGYYPLTENPESGLLLEFLHGSFSNGCGGVERSSTIKMVCDPAAGLGFPQGIEPVETASCRYTFIWESLYACPLCTPSDYYPILSTCYNGTQTRTWVPLDFPQLCHDGFPRPNTEVLNCSSISIYCPAGQYLNIDPRTSAQTCVPAPPGFFSIGGARSWTSFSTVPALPFEGNWIGGPHYIMSGDGDSTEELRLSLVVPGNITFKYKVYETDTEIMSDGFQFLIDGVVAIPLVENTNFRYVSFIAPLTDGPHVFRWSFFGGQLPGSTPTAITLFKGALVREITVTGTSLAALQPEPCPEGFYSPNPGASSCLICPFNTVAGRGSSSCARCPTAEFYALPGSTNCDLKLPCTADDYGEFFSFCVNGTRTRQLTPLSPQICRVDPTVYTPPAPQSGLDCGPCPPGAHRMNGANCTFCPPGTGHSGPDSMVCDPAPPGSFARPRRSYFIDNSVATWPAGFSTYCSGLSCLSSGWRIRGTSIDSGIHHSGEIDVVLDFTATLITDGSISFSYIVIGDADVDGLQFYVDGSSAMTPTHARDGVIATVPLTRGTHSLRWVYHQNQGPARVEMSDIEIEGDASGGADDLEFCPEGTYSDSSRQLACQPCPSGSISPSVGATQCATCGDGLFQSNSGQTSCDTCGDGTSPSEAHDACVTPCSWDFGTPELPMVYNFSDLSEVVYRAYVGSVDILFRLCSPMPEDNTCNSPSDGPLETYSCGMDFTTGQVLDLGSRLSVSYLAGPDPNSTVGTGIQFLYDHGDICKGGTHWTTKITDYCFDESTGTPPSRRIALEDCQYVISIYSLRGCRDCRPTDFEVTTGQCVDGKRKVSTVRKIACNSQFVTSNREETCSAYDVETPLWVFFGLLIAFIVVGIVLAVFVVKHRQVSHQYEVLLSNTSREPSNDQRDDIDLDLDEEEDQH